MPSSPAPARGSAGPGSPWRNCLARRDVGELRDKPTVANASTSPARGGPWRDAWTSCCQTLCPGQEVGRCRVSRRAEQASRAGTLISWVRFVPVVAFACNAEARVPGARVRLNAIAVQASQAQLAQTRPEGRCSLGHTPG
jgi:hypothetical protein